MRNANQRGTLLCLHLLLRCDNGLLCDPTSGRVSCERGEVSRSVIDCGISGTFGETGGSGVVGAKGEWQRLGEEGHKRKREEVKRKEMMERVTEKVNLVRGETEAKK